MGRPTTRICLPGAALAAAALLRRAAARRQGASADAGRLTDAVTRVTAGDLTARVPEAGAGPADLATAFNTMAAELERRAGDLEARNESARERAELSDAVLETALHAFVAMDADGRILAWNGRAEAMLGWPASLAVGRDLAGLIIPPAQRAAHRAGLQRYRDAGAGRMLSRRLQLRAMHRDGTEIPVEITISPLVIGGSIRFNAFIASGSQAQRAARHREAQNAVLGVLAQAATREEALDGTLAALGRELGWEVAAFWSLGDHGLRCERSWHDDGFGLSAFAAATEALELASGEDVPGRAWEQRATVWVANAQRDQHPRRAAAAKARLQSGVCLPVLVGGEPVGAIELVGCASRRPEPELVATLESLATQIGQFVERKRVEADGDRVKREFFALVSHELRTPLTSILGYLELLREEEELSVEGRHTVDVVDRNAGRLLHLVGDLLFVAQVQTGRFEMQAGVVRIDKLVAEAVEAAAPRAGEGGVRLAASHPEVGLLRGDRVRLSQLLDNLVSNALKFTPRGGEVRVALERDGSDAVLRISDTGVGIADADQQRLFERFFRTAQATDAAVAGVGLGLTISKAIVDGHGGRIEVTSSEGAGTTFTVRLPRLEPAPVV